jgi:hypothetical protein
MGMNRDQQKRRIPTSEELEQKGAISPATGRSSGERRGFLSRFYRAGRFRVSADVAARKHVGKPPKQSAATESSAPLPTSEQRGQIDQPLSPAGTAEQTPGQTGRRAIRIDDALRQRRGLGNRDA